MRSGELFVFDLIFTVFTLNYLLALFRYSLVGHVSGKTRHALTTPRSKLIWTSPKCGTRCTYRNGCLNGRLAGKNCRPIDPAVGAPHWRLGRFDNDFLYTTDRNQVSVWCNRFSQGYATGLTSVKPRGARRLSIGAPYYHCELWNVIARQGLSIKSGITHNTWYLPQRKIFLRLSIRFCQSIHVQSR